MMTYNASEANKLDDSRYLVLSMVNSDIISTTECFVCEHIGRLARMSVLYTEVDGSNPGSSMLFP